MNNDKDTTAYFEKMKKLSLTPKMRDSLRASLLEYARFHSAQGSVRIAEEARSMKQMPSSIAFIRRITINLRTMTAAIILMALLLGGGTSYAAQGAVPGDILYPVKVDVNDNVRSALALSDEAKASVQADLLKERLEEAETLAADGKLSASTSAALSARVASHYEAAIAHSNEAAARGDLSAATDVRASLSGAVHAYSRLLNNLDAHVHGNDSKKLVSLLDSYSADVASEQAAASTSVAKSSTAANDVAVALGHTNAALAQVRVDLVAQKASLSTSTYAEIASQLSLAESYQSDAKRLLSEKQYADAYTTAQSAIVRVNLAENMLGSSVRLHSHTKVDLDTLFGNGKEDEHASSSLRANTQATSSAESRERENTEVNGHARTQSTTSVGAGTHAESQDRENENDRTQLKAESSTSIGAESDDGNTTLEGSLRGGLQFDF